MTFSDTFFSWRFKGQEKEVQHCLEIITCGPSIYTMDHPEVILLLSCQPRVTVVPCFVYKVIRDLESIDLLSINSIHRIGLIHK